MRYLARLYAKLLELNIKRYAVYKIDFVIGLIAIALSNIASIIFFWVLFQHIPALNGWLFEEVLFLSGMTMLSFGFWHVFLSGTSFWVVEREVRSGNFDRLLLQPLSPTKYLILSRFDDDGCKGAERDDNRRCQVDNKTPQTTDRAGGCPGRRASYLLGTI